MSIGAATLGAFESIWPFLAEKIILAGLFSSEPIQKVSEILREISFDHLRRKSTPIGAKLLKISSLLSEVDTPYAKIPGVLDARCAIIFM